MSRIVDSPPVIVKEEHFRHSEGGTTIPSLRRRNDSRHTKLEVRKVLVNYQNIIWFA